MLRSNPSFVPESLMSRSLPVTRRCRQSVWRRREKPIWIRRSAADCAEAIYPRSSARRRRHEQPRDQRRPSSGRRTGDFRDMPAPEPAAERRIQFRIASGSPALGRYQPRLGRERDVQLAGTKEGFEHGAHSLFLRLERQYMPRHEHGSRAAVSC